MGNYGKRVRKCTPEWVNLSLFPELEPTPPPLRPITNDVVMLNAAHYEKRADGFWQKVNNNHYQVCDPKIIALLTQAWNEQNLLPGETETL